jgi:hypothetical protein
MGISISALLKTQTDPGASRHTGTGQTARGGGTNPSPGQPSTTGHEPRSPLSCTRSQSEA